MFFEYVLSYLHGYALKYRYINVYLATFDKFITCCNRYNANLEVFFFRNKC